jgi:hypothetical protein
LGDLTGIAVDFGVQTSNLILHVPDLFSKVVLLDLVPLFLLKVLHMDQLVFLYLNFEVLLEGLELLPEFRVPRLPEPPTTTALVLCLLHQPLDTNS